MRKEHNTITRICMPESGRSSISLSISTFCIVFIGHVPFDGEQFSVRRIIRQYTPVSTCTCTQSLLNWRFTMDEVQDLRSAAHTLLAFSARAGIEFIFTNLGSDHPAFIEAFAEMKKSGEPVPRIVVCPHEMTALSAAHGYAMVTRRPQLVLVHVDVGTQNLGGSVHNAARGRVPAIIIAGLSPVTDGADRVGTRNEFIHHIQDMPRQHEIVSPYMKWCYELRAPETVEPVMARAIQISTTPQEDPVYITGAREVWDGRTQSEVESLENWPASRLGGLSEPALAELYHALIASKRPLVITSYLGRQQRAVELLVDI